MNPIIQTIDTEEYGNCLEACLASIFEESIDNYPKCNTGKKWPHWIKPINSYLIKTHGCYLLCLETDTPEKDFMGYYIVVGDNRGTKFSHAMVGKAGKVIFDPSGHNLTEKYYTKIKYLVLVRTLY